MAFREYKPQSLQVPGITLPSWFYNTEPVTYNQAVAEDLALDARQLELEGAEQKREDQERSREAIKRASEELTEDDLLDTGKYLDKMKKIYLETENLDGLGKTLEAQRRYQEDLNKRGKPTYFNTSDGIVEFDDLGNSRLAYKTSKAPATEKAPKLLADFYHPETLATTKVDILNPQDRAIAESLGFKMGDKPTPYQMHVQQLEAQRKAKEAAKVGPGFFERMYNSTFREPTAEGDVARFAVKKKVKKNEIPRAPRG
jgi:hypothetical protein